MSSAASYYLPHDFRLEMFLSLGVLRTSFLLSGPSRESRACVKESGVAGFLVGMPSVGGEGEVWRFVWSELGFCC